MLRFGILEFLSCVVFRNVKKLASYFMDVLEEKQEKVMENLQVNDSKLLFIQPWLTFLTIMEPLCHR